MWIVGMTSYKKCSILNLNLSFLTELHVSHDYNNYDIELHYTFCLHKIIKMYFLLYCINKAIDSRNGYYNHLGYFFVNKIPTALNT